MNKVAINLKLDKDVVEMIVKLATPRKKGELVSKKLRPILKKMMKRSVK